jgi:hypothetical protein
MTPGCEWMADRAPDAPLDAEARAHLASCAECAARTRAAERVRAALRARPVEPDPALQARLLDALQARPRVPQLRLAFALASLVALASAGTFVVGGLRAHHEPARPRPALMVEPRAVEAVERLLALDELYAERTLRADWHRATAPLRPYDALTRLGGVR